MHDPISKFFSVGIVLDSLFLLVALSVTDSGAVTPEQQVPVEMYLFAGAFLLVGLALCALLFGRTRKAIPAY